MTAPTGTTDTAPTGDTTPPATGDEALGEGGKAALAAERKRANDADKALKAALAELQTIKDANKSEEDKRAERLTAAEKDAADAKAALVRYEVATEKGVPAELVGRLQGATKAELEADADALLKLFPPATGGKTPPPAGGKPTENLVGGGNPTGDAALNGDPLLDALKTKLGIA